MRTAGDASLLPGRLLSPDRRPTYASRMNPAAEDSALMLRYADGDAAAFEILYRRHNDALYRYCLRLSNDRDAAADLFQEVWSRIIRARHRYRPTAKFATYLYRVAHNTFIDHLRRNKRYSAGPADDDADRQPAESEAPDVLADRATARERLMAALAALPPEQRDAFLLHEEAGLTLEQIASVTGGPRETVKSRLRYATKKLKTALVTATTEAGRTAMTGTGGREQP